MKVKYNSIYIIITYFCVVYWEVNCKVKTDLYGFYIYINQTDKKKFERIVPEEAGMDSDNIKFENFSFSYVKFDKFHHDKIFAEDERYIIGIDGVIYNLKSLKNKFAISDYFKLLVHLFEKEKIHFASYLKGVFSGFVFDKKKKSLFFFNDKTATKQIFYSKFDDNILIAPSISSIIENKQKLNELSSLNIPAMYNMLTFGGMIEKETLVNDIYKLGAGEYITVAKKDIIVNRYADFNNIDYTISNKRNAINNLNEVFINAIKLEYDKDKEYDYQHIATLSGGLDSRMNVMLAHKMRCQPDTFCFSQSNYADESIARKIAKDLKLDFKFFPLDGGDYLKNLSEMVSINSGLQFYHGSAHYHYALRQLELSPYGLMHTGQIGDGILGGFVSKGKTKDLLSKTISNRFIEKASVDKNIVNSYANEEVFKLYQRVFNLANYGSYVVEQNGTYLASPFFDEDVIKVSLSIDPKLKYNQLIYLEWINKLHPEVAKYKWERTGFRPNYAWKTGLSRYTNKIKKEYYHLTKQKDKLSMNPIEYWYQSNPSIQSFYTRYYDENISLVKTNNEVYSDLSLLFTTGNITEKAIVLTLLEVIKKYNLSI